MLVQDCRHIHIMGRRCGSPALNGQPYCFFHTHSRTRHRTSVPETPEIVAHPLHPDFRGQFAPLPVPAELTLDFPPIEDHESIQVATSMILGALGRNILEPRRAASMLYALQVATAVTRRDDDGVSEYLVQIETVLSPDGTDIAPEDAPSLELQQV